MTVNLLDFPEELKPFRVMAESALRQWTGGARVRCSRLKQGFSGSAVIKVDISNITCTDHIRSGQYILKLSEHPQWADQDDEITAHHRAQDRNEKFSSEHIPALVVHYSYSASTGMTSTDDESLDSGYAILFEIAGHSIDTYTAMGQPQDPHFDIIGEKIHKKMLRHWVEQEPSKDLRPDQIIETLAGYRLDPDQAPELHEFINMNEASAGILIVADEALVSPLWLYRYLRDHPTSSQPVLEALLHGDLHGENLLAHRQMPNDHPFWVIDFAYSTIGPAGFDQAYLEMHHIRLTLGNQPPAVLIGILRKISDPTNQEVLPPGTSWTRKCIQSIRDSQESWISESHSRRRDSIHRQLTLVRVAAGLNWARKKIPDEHRYLALCYAGWAAREYLKQYDAEGWKAFQGLSPYPKSADFETGDEPSEMDRELWKQLWSSLDCFSARNSKLLMIVGPMKDDDDLRVLGRLPLSAVFDLDPHSDQTGLYRRAGSVLEEARGLHLFSDVLPLINVRRGTSWMMAAGWMLKGESFPDLRRWRYARMPLIRQFIKKMDDQIRPEAMQVLVLPGHGYNVSRILPYIGQVVGAIDEVTEGRTKFFLLGSHALLPEQQIENIEYIPLQVGHFVSFLNHTLGGIGPKSMPTVPGPNGEERPISVGMLRNMEENFRVLHSDVLSETPELVDDPDDSNAFWRGRPLYFSEINAGMDIKREVGAKLTEILQNYLEDHNTRTVVFQHHPGSGGTTAAYRAVWDLHWEHPTALLVQDSPSLGIRLRDLFHAARKPVLFLAEEPDLQDSRREELYRELAHFNSRVVIFYLRRVLGGIEKGISLDETLTDAEASQFQASYSSLTEESERIKDLQRITTEGSLRRYRTPFFYGLVTFQREYAGIDRFVDFHLSNIRGRQLDVMEFLGLVTIYSDTGIPEQLLKGLFRVSPNSEVPLSTLFGDGPYRIVNKRLGVYRLMHQIIAEKVLSYLHSDGDGDWMLRAKDIAIDFIQRLVEAAGPDSNTVIILFRKLFIDRVGGSLDGVEDRKKFSSLIEDVNYHVDNSHGHAILKALAETCPLEPHFWTHLGRHHIYEMKWGAAKAEEYLQKAISLSENDAIHHHAYGLVLRYRMRGLLKLRAGETADQILERIRGVFEKASEQFNHVRAIKPDNIYGYITHIQMNLQVLRRIKSVSGWDTLGRVQGGDGAVGEFVIHLLTTAEHLLNEASHLYGTLAETKDSYFTKCQADLARLYGDMDQVVQLWDATLSHHGGRSGPMARRALANAFFARNNRRWDTMQLGELRRIVALMEENLNSSVRRDEDFRLWFEAFLKLPEFETEQVLVNLSSWAREFPSWRPFYYIYVVHLLRWLSGESDSIDDYEAALEKCSQLFVGRKTKSDLWIGKARTGGFTLTSFSELGEWNKGKNFWEFSSVLRRINGMIEDPIPGPQGGYIRIDNVVRAFFVPGITFSSYRDENKPVNFFLGLSPSGPRAWSPERGHVEDGNRISTDSLPEIADPLQPLQEPISDSVKQERLQQLREARIYSYISDLIQAKASIESPLTLDELRGRVDAAFGVDGLFDGLADGQSRQAISKRVGCQFEQRDGTECVILPNQAIDGIRPKSLCGYISFVHESQTWGYIQGEGKGEYWFHKSNMAGNVLDFEEGCLVRFTPDFNEKGGIAFSINLLRDSVLFRDGIIPASEALNKAIPAFVYEYLSGNDRRDGVLLPDLIRVVETYFLPPLSSNFLLGTGKFAKYFNGIDGIIVSGVFPDLRVQFEPGGAFGRLSSAGLRDPGPLAQETENARENNEDRREVKRFAIQLVEEAENQGQTISAKSLGNQLSNRFKGSGKLMKRLGYDNFSQFIETTPELELVGLEPNRIVASVPTVGAGGDSDDQTTLDPVRVKEKIIRFLQSKKKGEPVPLAQLGQELASVYGNSPNVASRLGYSNLKEYINSIQELKVGEPPRDLVRILTGSSSPSSIAHHPWVKKRLKK